MLQALVSTCDFETQVRVILEQYDNDHYKYDEYWIPIFEAHMLGQYADAETILRFYLRYISSDRYRDIKRMYFPFLVALLEIGNHPSDLTNVSFEGNLSLYMGRLLEKYNKYVGVSDLENSPEGWALGKFQRAFRSYFNGAAPHFWIRITQFCEPLQTLSKTLSGPGPLIEQVSRELLYLMSTDLAIRTMSSAWMIERVKHNLQIASAEK